MTDATMIASADLFMTAPVSSARPIRACNLLQAIRATLDHGAAHSERHTDEQTAAYTPSHPRVVTTTPHSDQKRVGEIYAADCRKHGESLASAAPYILDVVRRHC